MTLKSLEILGFKTFPDKTKLEFDKGITAVVGPNGSGKSNISDAIRWVFGEQSTKNLRCSKMEDVIFDGTVERKSKGFAKVTLTIENQDRGIAFDSDYVSITRMYYRSGESSYLINNKSVRLKDIYELFMDTGLGKDGYSVIGQGKVDSVVSSRPSDIREIFEEAAGISKFRYRKSEAERQLDKTQANLTRLSDIISQLEERVEPLRIQSEKAQIFVECSNEKKSLEVGLWLETLLKSEQVLREQDNKILLARNRANEAEEKVDGVRKNLEKNFYDTNLISSKINDKSKEVSAFEKDASDKNRELSVLKNDVNHSNESIEKISHEIEVLKKLQEDYKYDLTKVEKQISEQKSVTEKIENNLNLALTDFKKLEAEIGGTENLNNQISNELAELNKNLENTKLEIMNADSTQKQLDLNLNKITATIEEHYKLKDELELQVKNSLSILEEKHQKRLSEQRDLELLEEKLKVKSRSHNKLKSQLDRLDLSTKEKISKIKLLNDLEQNFEGFTRSVKFVMNRANKSELKGIHGPISRLFEVKSEYSLAFEIALGSAMQNIVVDSEADAKEAILALKENNIGRATFLPINSIRSRGIIKENLSDIHGVIGVASNLCNAKSVYRDIIDFLLGRTAIVDNIDTAIQLAKRFNYKFKIVTLDGQVVNSGGSLTGGSSSKSSGLISRKSEIDKLEKEVKALNEQTLNLRNEHNILIKEISELEVKSAKLRENIIELKNEITLENSNLENSKQRLAFLNLETEKQEQEKKDIYNQKERLQLTSENLSADKEILSKKILNSQNRLSLALSQQKDIINIKEEKREHIQSLQLEKLSKEKDIELLTSKSNTIKQSIKDSDIKVSSFEEQAKETKNNILKINDNIEVLNKQIEDLSKSLDTYKQDIESLKNQRIDLEKNNTKLREYERELLEERECLNRDLVRLEERGITLQKNYDDIIAKLWDEYELTRSEAEATTAAIDDIQSAKKRLSELKLKIKQLGCVNLSAIEEYKELSERYKFMKAEFDDIQNSKNEIIKHIDSLTKDMKSLFLRKFDDINKNFKEIFVELFSGGSANLELLDKDNILESGIEIQVSPPGKIVSNLDSLSGGEKALVSISIYFAIMRVNPAPFCVLDEIEAALDDVNVVRYAKYLRRMNEKTQFIIITHRRGSMEEADILYGVTMQEKGVSKLLKLKASEISMAEG